MLDLTQDTVEPNKMIKGTIAHDKSGAEIKGTIETQEEIKESITEVNQKIEIPPGVYDEAGEVSIDENSVKELIAENIKKDVKILGITGTLADFSVDDIDSIFGGTPDSDE